MLLKEKVEGLTMNNCGRVEEYITSFIISYEVSITFHLLQTGYCTCGTYLSVYTAA